MKEVPFHRYIISLICTAVIAGGGVYLLQNREVKLVEETQQTDELVKVRSLYEAINQNYYEEVDKNQLIEGALKGMTDALGDPYTSYLTETEAEKLDESLADSFEGIGASLTLVDDYPQVAQAPIKKTPAEKSGLRMHDIILKVDGEETKGEALTDVVKRIRGKKGTVVTLTVKRGEEEFDLEIMRDTIPIETVHGEIDEENPTIGKIEVTSFSQGTAREFKEAIENLRKDGAKQFVIDLRQNPGGLLDQVQNMASMFLEDGKPIVKFATDEKILKETNAGFELDGGFKVKEPTVVLVDGGSASASEIFAAAVNESAGIPIVGTQTFGKGTVQNVNHFGDNSELKMTIMKWLTPNEEWINEKGITPTEKADFPEYAYLPPLPRDKVLKKGQNSDEINHLNQFLQALGYQTAGDEFNEATEQAVKAIQAENQLSETGEVDPQTTQVIELAIVQKVRSDDQAYLKAIELLQAP